MGQGTRNLRCGEFVAAALCPYPVYLGCTDAIVLRSLVHEKWRCERLHPGGLLNEDFVCPISVIRIVILPLFYFYRALRSRGITRREWHQFMCAMVYRPVGEVTSAGKEHQIPAAQPGLNFHGLFSGRLRRGPYHWVSFRDRRRLVFPSNLCRANMAQHPQA